MATVTIFDGTKYYIITTTKPLIFTLARQGINITSYTSIKEN